MVFKLASDKFSNPFNLTGIDPSPFKIHFPKNHVESRVLQNTKNEKPKNSRSMP
jgi:hypothetical protein